MEQQYTQPVRVEGISTFADASPTLVLIFATVCTCFWANTMGFFPEGGVLAIGILQLAVFVGYTLGGMVLLHRGNGFGGNTFMIFASFFGGIGGASNVALALAGEAGIPYSGKVSGIAFIIAGIFLLMMLPGVRYASKCDFLMYLTGGLGTLGYGLTGAGLCPASLNYPAAWLVFVDACIGMYVVAATMLKWGGITLSLGKPFFCEKDISSLAAEA